MMKQLKVFLLVIPLILSLFGCTVNKNIPTECISDTIDVIPSPAMYIASDVPQGACLTLSRDDGKYAVFSHPDYEITQEIFTATSWDDAFLHVCGRSAQDLKPILAGNFPQEKYRCTWTVAGEKGTDLCQSLIFFDGSFYYAISVQCAAQKAGTYADAFSDLLSCAELCSV